MISIFDSLNAYQTHLARQTQAGPAGVETTVREILETVRAQGDPALLAYTERFDKVRPDTLRVPREAMEQASAEVDPAMRDIWIQAMHNVEVFHQRQKEDSSLEFFQDGTLLGWKVTPIQRAGVYIPGGRAVYPSSLIMNVVPARVAGVPEIVVVSPPGPNGLPHRDVLACAALLEVEEMYAMGGAQAVGALAYGTQTIRPVDKITGPGNAYVAEAKRQVFGRVGIDSVAGPSEILILSDGTGKVEYLARDLLSQAEHDPEARAVLVTTSREEAQRVKKHLEEIVPGLPRREIIESALKGGSGIVVVNTLEAAIEAANQIAPEHLEIMTADPMALLPRIRHAGAVFLGANTPEPVGDYFAGPNHTLPTGGTARFSSPLSVQDFTKKSSVLMYSAQRLQKEGEAIARFADREELAAHAAAIRVRLGTLKQ
ncbi:MAG: histidinol dehydrogenase [Deltaproteobacteria bacterium]|nr:histidinol dehydrogenase [Deltaproteobacteria bacterium]